MRNRIGSFERAGLFGKGKVYQRNRHPGEYMIAEWGHGCFPYLYQRRPGPNFDPAAMGNTTWDLYREMWGSHGEYEIDGNLKSVEYAGRLKTIEVRSLITAGDHDECAPSLSEERRRLIQGSKLVILPESGHMTFVDQPALFLKAVLNFLGTSQRLSAGSHADRLVAGDHPRGRAWITAQSETMLHSADYSP